ncbi:MAG: hybrid sensor histidine kinase/response regulator [Planctomycetaceae bacterium]|nr:hybrid sensor histidine kinase/response regulator [Planctomycetaceae bacterium]
MRVLIAEDNALMRRMLVRTLEEWGYEVAAAANGERAWRLFQQQPFQLLLTDWVMPETDGLELIRRIRSSDYRRYVYILLLTALSEKSDLVEGMEAGADDFLVKPVDHDELRVRLREGERIIGLERALAEQNRQLRDTQAALVQSEKLAGLGQMAAGMAHELNNPIAVVSNNLAVLQRDVTAALEILALYRSADEHLRRAAPELAARIARLVDQCDLPWIESESTKLFERSSAGLSRVRDIVENLRNFARLDAAESDAVDVAETLRAVADIVRHEFESRNVDLVVDASGGLIVECEPAKIQQAVQNLLVNALQASDAGATVQLRAAAAAEGAIIEVEDAGCGIPAADLPHLFDPFFTTRPVGGGQGLGLAIAHGIVRNHGGEIEVDSQFGTGSTFRILLPLKPPKTEANSGVLR